MLKNFWYGCDKRFCGLMVFSALVTAGSNAQAGTWGVQVGIKNASDGTLKLVNPGFANNTTFQANWNPNDSEDWYAMTGISPAAQEHVGQELSASSQGTFTLRAVWTPAYTNEPVPEKLVVLFRRDVTSRAARNATSTAEVTLEADAGEAPPTGEGAPPADYNWTYPTNGYTTKYTDRTRLFKQLLTLSPRQEGHWENGKLVIEKQVGGVSGKAKIKIGTVPGPNGTSQPDNYVQVYVIPSTSALEDTRSVRLTRDGAPPALPVIVVNNGVGEPNPDLVKNRDEWVDIDGTGHGHTLTSYWERSAVNDGTGLHCVDDPLDVLHAISATRSGAWSLPNQLEWKWTPDATDNLPTQADTSWRESKVMSQSINGQIRQMIRSNAINNPEGVISVMTPLGEFAGFKPAEKGWINHESDKKGQKVNFQYDLKDLVDGAKAIAKYELTLHDVWENPVPDLSYNITIDGVAKPGWSKRQMFRVISSLFAYKPGPGEAEPTWKVTNESTFTLEAGLDLEGGFKFKDYVNLNMNFGADTTSTTEKTQNQAARHIANIPGTTVGTKFFRVIEFEMRRSHWYIDKFGVSGFVPNPNTQQFSKGGTQSLWGKWRQAKDEDAGGWTPNWLAILPEDNMGDPSVGFTGIYDSTSGRSVQSS